LAMNQGQQIEFGAKDEVLAKVLKRTSPLKIIHEVGTATA
jgi:hypothetical protein